MAPCLNLNHLNLGLHVAGRHSNSSRLKLSLSHHNSRTPPSPLPCSARPLKYITKERKDYTIWGCVKGGAV